MDETTFDSCLKAGFVARKTADRSLGDLEPDEMLSMATDIVLDPSATSEITGFRTEDYHAVDTEVLRNNLMEEYNLQRAADSLVTALEDEHDTRESVIARRRAAIYRCSGANGSDSARIEADRSSGDSSAANKAREIFFFE